MRSAARMATGVATRTAPTESASAAAMRASADKPKVLVLLRQAPLVRRDLVDCLVERPARLPAGQFFEGSGIRPAASELLEARPVRVLVGHEPDCGLGICPFDDAPRERDDRDLLARPDVEH